MNPDEISRSRRWHAVECNNLAWNLVEIIGRTSAQEAQMLHAAHASAFHWGHAGNELHSARAELLLAHVYAALGHGDLAQNYAGRSTSYLLSHSPPDWEAALCHAVIAHVAYAVGDSERHRSEYLLARNLGKAINDPDDRAIFLQSFAVIPPPSSNAR